eukprot:1049605-Alexandrium_andersonii.AAC.1
MRAAMLLLASQPQDGTDRVGQFSIQIAFHEARVKADTEMLRGIGQNGVLCRSRTSLTCGHLCGTH